MLSTEALLRRLLFVALAFIAVQAAYNVAQLPALSAVAFDRHGAPLVFAPTEWLLYAHVGAAVVLVIGGVWLPGRRRDAAPAEVRSRTWSWLLALVLLAVVAQAFYDANRAPIPRFGPASLAWIAAAAALWAGVTWRGWRAGR